MIPVFVIECSTTAERPFGHMAFIGAASTRSSRTAPDQGHRFYSTSAPTFHCTDNNAEVLRRRACWDLYAGCDRAPLNWERVQ